MMPMEPAKATRIVRVFLVSRLLSDRDSAVKNDMPGFFTLPCGAGASVSGSAGRVSSTTRPSSSRMTRVEYACASSGLCVTMITSRSRAISFKSSITCTLVSLSSAPVGSSASSTSGLLISARAIATRCICPPDICDGFL